MKLGIAGLLNRAQAGARHLREPPTWAESTVPQAAPGCYPGGPRGLSPSSAIVLGGDSLDRLLVCLKNHY
jgi:hypothetical protein